MSATKSAVKEAVAETEAESIKKTALPVTVLAGFLGAGKVSSQSYFLVNAHSHSLDAARQRFCATC